MIKGANLGTMLTILVVGGFCNPSASAEGQFTTAQPKFRIGRFNAMATAPIAITSRGGTNDECTDAELTPLALGGTVVFNGNNVGANTENCSSLEAEATWHAVMTDVPGDLTVSLCGTNPPFSTGYIVIDDHCPCDGEFFYYGSYAFECADENLVVKYYNVPAGDWWVPVYTDASNVGPYTLSVSLADLTTPCGTSAGDCCLEDETPGCEDADCCDAVCAERPFCCDVAWDSLCVDIACVEPLCDEGSCLKCPIHTLKTGSLIGLDGNIYDALLQIDVDTGEAAFEHFFEFDPSGGALAVGPDGTLYASFSGSVDQLVIIDPDSGKLSFVGPFGFDSVSALAFSPDGVLFGFDDTSDQLIVIDTATGQGTPVGAGPISGRGLAFGPDGTLYLVGTPGVNPILYSVNPDTGAATEIGSFGSEFDGSGALEFVGNHLYADATEELTGFGSLVEIDEETGEASKIGYYAGEKDGPYMSGLAFLPGPGDGDRDGDVDEDDVAFFKECFGPLDEEDKSPYCAFLDSDKDGDLDCDDWEAFIPNWTEESEPPTLEPCDGPLPCDGDANGDGVVDPLDTGYIMARFGCAVGTGDAECDAADVNVDSMVDPLDAGYALARFGSCE